MYTYSVPDMGACCVAGVKKAFKDDELFGDCDVLVSHLTHTVTLKLDDEDAFKLLEDRDVHARVAKLLDDIGQASEPSDVETKPVGWSHTSQGTLGLFSGFFLLFLPLFVTSMPWFLTVTLASASLGLTIGLGWSFYRHAYRGLRQGNWTMDTLFSISTGMILLVSVTALFVPGLPMMFEAGLLIFGFRHAGLAIEEAFKAGLASSTRLQDDTALPHTVQLENGDVITRDEIKRGDIFYINPNDTLSVDGAFVSGSGWTSNKYQHGSERLADVNLREKLQAGTKLCSVTGCDAMLFKQVLQYAIHFWLKKMCVFLKLSLNVLGQIRLPSPTQRHICFNFLFQQLLLLHVYLLRLWGLFLVHGCWVCNVLQPSWWLRVRVRWV